MDIKITGLKIELEEVLAARERRCITQKELLEKYKLPIISFTLNIVGSIKVFPLTVSTFYEGLRLIHKKCAAEHIVLSNGREYKGKTGYEACIVADTDALRLKQLMVEIEENEPLGRIFDIDVLRPDGAKVSRMELGVPERKCLLCEEFAHLCARSRAHQVEELIENECRIMSEYFIKKHAKHTATLAVKALLYEVTVTPKPGLVDRNNNGAHVDMDIFTFIDSALSLNSYFEKLVLKGSQHPPLSLEELFRLIRPLGIEAEFDMLCATGGVNTHKGVIFSLGIICCAIGWLYVTPNGYSREDLSQACSEMTASLMKDFENMDTETSGKKLFSRYGATGVRGEAIRGFPSVLKLALPELYKNLVSGISYNDACIKTLMRIIAAAEDTNIAARSSYDRMLEIKKEMGNMLDSGLLDSLNFKDKIKELDQSYIDENISPGGSADILALAIFLQFYEINILEDKNVYRS